MKQEIQAWADECSAFQKWFSDLGGNIANNEQMTEAFMKIEIKAISDNNLYALLEANENYINGMEVTL